MDRAECTAQLVELLQQGVYREAASGAVRVDESSALIGPQAIISSLGLVSFIADAEILLAEDYGLELVLVSEAALSRSRSPFLTILTLVDYVGELAAAADEQAC